MNREGERILKRKGLSDRDIQAIKLENEYQRGFRAGQLHAIEFTFYLTAYTINYKLGFGAKRLKRIMRYIYNNIDSFRTKHLERADYPEIKRQMNKLGVEIK